MEYQNTKQGMSIIEILIYVAILAVIGVVLSNYFVAAVTTQTEHDRRDDLANSAQNITAAFTQDVAQASQLSIPTSGATSSLMTLMTPNGTVTFAQSGSTLVRISGSSTQSIINSKVNVRELSFFGNAYTEPRLAVTTTSVQYHVLLEHSREPGMVRSVNGTLLIGKDRL